MSLIKHQLVQNMPIPLGSIGLRKAQSGVVLFVSMVALVVMSLAAVALIRSVDTNSQIAGNLTFKQTAAISSSYGIESMADALGTLPLGSDTVTDAANGYYARCSTFDQGAASPCNAANITVDANWVPGATSRLATIGAGVITGGVDAYGNTVQYIVERMCTAVGTVTNAACLLATKDLKNGSFAVKGYPGYGPMQLLDIPVYRVTVRVVGPKNTVSYIQAFIS